MARGHAEELAPMVERAMRAAGVSFAELDRLAVTTGPGTFTGQRVGLAFMRALKLSLKKPLAGISTLDAMAAAALDKSDFSWAVAAHRCQARRNSILGAFACRVATLLIAPELIALCEAPGALAPFAARLGPVALAGTAAPLLGPAAARLRKTVRCDSPMRCSWRGWRRNCRQPR